MLTQSRPPKSAILFIHAVVPTLEAELIQKNKPTLNHFFQIHENVSTPLHEVSKAAYSKARKKISPQVYVQLRDDLNSFSETNFDLKRWEGFRLLAIDGTTLQLPESKELLEHFGFQENQHSKVTLMARASQSFDVLNRGQGGFLIFWRCSRFLRRRDLQTS